MYKDFHELPIWKEGYSLLMKVYDNSDALPDTEKYGLTSQIRRSANSIIANIAESHGRYHFADKKRILYIARGELYETRSHLAVAYGRKFIAENAFVELNNGYKDLTKQLNGYIRSMK